MTEELQELKKSWVEDLVYYIKEGCKSFLEVGKLLVEGEKKELWRGDKYKSFREFLDSGVLGIGKSQAYQFIHAYRNAQNLKLTQDKAVEIGITKLALIHKLPKDKQSVHKVDKSKVSELKAEATHIQTLTFFVDNEEAKVVEQAINTILKNEKIENKGKALYLMAVDYLSGVGWHEDRPLTGKAKQTLMRESWEVWKKCNNWVGKETDKFYSRNAKNLEIVYTIPIETQEKGYRAIIGWLDKSNLPHTYETIIRHLPEYMAHPEKYEAEKTTGEKLEDRSKARERGK